MPPEPMWRTYSNSPKPHLPSPQTPPHSGPSPTVTPLSPFELAYSTPERTSERPSGWSPATPALWPTRTPTPPNFSLQTPWTPLSPQPPPSSLPVYRPKVEYVPYVFIPRTPSPPPKGAEVIDLTTPESVRPRGPLFELERIPPTRRKILTRSYRTESKGFGLVAQADIKRGTVILAERPFCTLSHPITPSSAVEAFEQLSDRHRLLFLSFPAKIGDEVFSSVAETNVIPMQDGNDSDSESDDDGQSGLFERISRVNHSCAPNAEWRWDADVGEELLYALRPIKKTEEITASYLPAEETLLPFTTRQCVLRTKLGFNCLCSFCALGDKEDRALTDLRSELIRWVDESNNVADPGAARRIETAIAELKRLGRDMLLDEAWDALFAVHAAWGRRDEAMEAAEELYRCLEIKYQDAEGFPAAQWRVRPEAWSGWGCMLPGEEEKDDDYVDAEDMDVDGVTVFSFNADKPRKRPRLM